HDIAGLEPLRNPAVELIAPPKLEPRVAATANPASIARENGEQQRAVAARARRRHSGCPALWERGVVRLQERPRVELADECERVRARDARDAKALRLCHHAGADAVTS